jgi:hypothetical protein
MTYVFRKVGPCLSQITSLVLRTCSSFSTRTYVSRFPIPIPSHWKTLLCQARHVSIEPYLDASYSSTSAMDSRTQEGQ